MFSFRVYTYQNYAPNITLILYKTWRFVCLYILYLCKQCISHVYTCGDLVISIIKNLCVLHILLRSKRLNSDYKASAREVAVRESFDATVTSIKKTAMLQWRCSNRGCCACSFLTKNVNSEKKLCRLKMLL